MKCDNCGTPLLAGRTSCYKCGLVSKPTQTQTGSWTNDQREELSKDISQRLVKSWQFRWAVAWRLFLIFFGGIGLLTGWGIWSAIQHLRQGVQTQLDQAAREMSNMVTHASALMNSNILREFQEPRVRQTVEGVAAKEAKTILERQVRPSVEKFRRDAEFLRLATRARGYDFRAYLRLLDMEKGTNELSGYAKQVLAEIDRALERDRSSLNHKVFATASGTNTYPGPFSSDELAIRFKRIQKDEWPYNREGFVNTVAALNQPLFLEPLVSTLTNETDLGVADRLAIAISSLAKQDFRPHDFERINNWWQLHGRDYTNWPFADLARGISQLDHGDTNAATSFEKVLQLDPKADMSRALLVECLAQMGRTNEAARVAKGFAPGRRRWARWAAARMNLMAGGASNATVAFANLKKEDPGMFFLPKEGAPAWSNIDWRLYRERSGAK